MGSVVVAIGVRDDGKSREEVPGAKDGAVLVSVSGVPEGKTVTEQVLGRSSHAKLNLDLPITHGDRLGE